MLTKLTIRNFKRLSEAVVDLGKSVVFIGPNNSGKTSALQALALWRAGLRVVLEKQKAGSQASQRTGIAINRKDLVDVPVAAVNLLWSGTRISRGNRRIPIEIIVEGQDQNGSWTCGIEFQYGNDESLYCDLILQDGKERRVPVGAEAVAVNMMPPMSGLDPEEALLPLGRVAVLIGQGRTAEVLRNLCYLVFQENESNWRDLCAHLRLLFNVELDEPEFVTNRGEIRLTYREGEARYDLSSLGRGCQQTLLLLTHLYRHPRTVLLLDEPDAHLEILRQQQVYRLLNEIAGRTGCQVIAASHSEVVMKEAVDRQHSVVAFLGRPHLVANTKELRKSLAGLGWDQYYSAEQKGWVLYVEGSTDLEILRRFAYLKGHAAKVHLEAPFVHYVCNLPAEAERHFRGLREAKADLVGIAIYDRLEGMPNSTPELKHSCWKRREIENYFATHKTLVAWAGQQEGEDLFSQNRADVMEQSIDEIVSALSTLGKDPWSHDFKVSDEFLDPLFKDFSKRLGGYNEMPKGEFFHLIDAMDTADIPAEIVEKLDAIAAVAGQAQPAL